MERINVEVSNRCNFDCEFCPQGDLKRGSQDMPLGLFQSICDQLDGGRLAREIHFHVMGEPLLYRPLAEAVAYARHRGLITVVTTNGSLLTPSRAGELCDAGLHRLVVSLQTPDAESFAIRGAKGLAFEDYERGIETSLKHLLSLDGETHVVLALRTTAFPRLQQPGSDLRIIGDSEELHRHVRRWLRAILDGSVSAPDLKGMEGMAGRASVARWNIVRVTPRFTIESRPLGGWVKPTNGKRFYPARIGTCHALSEMFAVQSNGDITFCCLDHEGDTRVGNARTMPLASFFGHPEVLRAYRGFQRFRIVHPKCQQCLGEPGLLPSLGHQVGSIIYLRLVRDLFKREITAGAP